MSHIGKKGIQIPLDIKISCDKSSINIVGGLGNFYFQLPKEINCILTFDSSPQLYVKLNLLEKNEKISKKSLSIWGTYRSLIYNMIVGVSRGFSKKLELVGVGYKAYLDQENILNLKLGYSHIIRYIIPQDVKIQCLKPTLIFITGIDKQRVNQIASEIRHLRKPEPYKGKGIRYGGEILYLKEGKKK